VRVEIFSRCALFYLYALIDRWRHPRLKMIRTQKAVVCLLFGWQKMWAFKEKCLKLDIKWLHLSACIINSWLFF